MEVCSEVSDFEEVQFVFKYKIWIAEQNSLIFTKHLPKEETSFEKVSLSDSFKDLNSTLFS